MDPRQTLEAFDVFLEQRGLRFEGVVVGGAALNLLGLVARTTKDCDVLDPEIPASIASAALAFAAVRRRSGEVFPDDWFNNGPRSLTRDLPSGWAARVRPLFHGKCLRLGTLGRDDFLRLKLFALCGRGLDLGDCIALAPTPEELHRLGAWLEERDANELWPAHVRATVADLARKLGHAV